MEPEPLTYILDHPYCFWRKSQFLCVHWMHTRHAPLWCTRHRGVLLCVRRPPTGASHNPVFSNSKQNYLMPLQFFKIYVHCYNVYWIYFDSQWFCYQRLSTIFIFNKCTFPFLVLDLLCSLILFLLFKNVCYQHYMFRTSDILLLELLDSCK